MVKTEQRTVTIRFAKFKLSKKLYEALPSRRTDVVNLVCIETGARPEEVERALNANAEKLFGQRRLLLEIQE
jgi:hypothetical protein